jgi:two-component system cell cycle response regulator
MIKEASFDIVFLDYLLSDGNGFNFISEINQSGINVPVAVITDHGDEIIASQLIQAGAFDYLPKDKLNTAALIRVINTVIEKARLLKDVDFFKSVNDTHGHVAGDMVLRTIGHHFKKSMRTNDIACRFGGEEFVILLPNTDKKNGVEVAQKLRKNIAGIPFQADTAQFSITLSIGVASSADADSFGDILERADKALFRAKDSGRNRVVLFK